MEAAVHWAVEFTTLNDICAEIYISLTILTRKEHGGPRFPLCRLPGANRACEDTSRPGYFGFRPESKPDNCA